MSNFPPHKKRATPRRDPFLKYVFKSRSLQLCFRRSNRVNTSPPKPKASKAPVEGSGTAVKVNNVPDVVPVANPALATAVSDRVVFAAIVLSSK